MSFSTITKKKCKQNGCNRYPNISLAGYCWEHAPEEIKSKYTNKRDLQRKAQNRNKAILVKIRADDRKKDISTGETFKEVWFKARRREMTGICSCGCGKPSSKNDDANFRSSICHILPQRHFESVQFHPLNWIELAFWGGDHTNFDQRGSDRWPQLACWETIIERFQVIYPLTKPEEHQFIPEILLKTLINPDITPMSKSENT